MLKSLISACFCAKQTLLLPNDIFSFLFRKKGKVHRYLPHRLLIVDARDALVDRRAALRVANTKSIDLIKSKVFKRRKSAH